MRNFANATAPIVFSNSFSMSRIVYASVVFRRCIHVPPFFSGVPPAKCDLLRAGDGSLTSSRVSLVGTASTGPVAPFHAAVCTSTHAVGESLRTASKRRKPASSSRPALKLPPVLWGDIWSEPPAPAHSGWVRAGRTKECTKAAALAFVLRAYVCRRLRCGREPGPCRCK